ncbi:MAG: hypothetical protein AAFV69_15775 [Pseudomonadota bacterium]
MAFDARGADRRRPHGHVRSEAEFRFEQRRPALSPASSDQTPVATAIAKQSASRATDIATEHRHAYQAVHGLRDLDPGLSAEHLLNTRQQVFVVVFTLTVCGVGVLIPGTGHALLFGLLTMPFLSISFIRLIALRDVLSSRNKLLRERPTGPLDASNQDTAPSIRNGCLPRYAILAPLYQEAESFP